MSDAEAERSNGGGSGNAVVWFLYVGQPIDEIPRDVSHVRIDSSVKILRVHSMVASNWWRWNLAEGWRRSGGIHSIVVNP